MTRPPPEVLSLLNPTERAAFELADFATRRMEPANAAWRAAFMGAMLWGAGGRRFDIRGISHVADMGRDASVLFVANHRSYFDFYIVTAAVYWRTKLSRRVLYPVRSNFFYDHPLGPVMNATMSGNSMFPPLFRDPNKAPFNRYSLERCVMELSRPGTVMGLHPEGTRNKGDDPYSLLPAKPGVGRVALEAVSARVHPIFIHGVTNDLALEWRRNWLMDPSLHPITVTFGPAIDLSDLRREGSLPAVHKRASERCTDAIRALAEDLRRERR